MTSNVRSAVDDDVSSIAEVHVASWKAAYRGLVEQRVLDNLHPVDRVKLWQRLIPSSEVDVLVSEAAGKIVGFVAVRSWADDPSCAWLPTLYVHPDHWRRGHGRALMEAAVLASSRRGCSSLFLWVIEDNTSARSFYERLGLSSDGQTKLDSTTIGVPLREVRYAKAIYGDGASTREAPAS